MKWREKNAISRSPHSDQTMIYLHVLYRVEEDTSTHLVM